MPAFTANISRCARASVLATHLLEVRAGGEDLVHEVLNTEDVVLLERPLDDGVVRERDALLVHLPVPALVDQLAHGLQVGLAKRITISVDGP
jgi:hypothetical protein